MSIRSMAGRVAGAVTTDNQRGALREMFRIIRGSSRRGAFAAAALTALLSPLILTRSDARFAQDRDAVLADLATRAIVLHWHAPDAATRQSLIRGYHDEIFDIPAEEIMAYAQEHFAELANAPGVDRKTLLRAYAVQARDLAGDPGDDQAVRAEINALLANDRLSLGADNVWREVERLNRQRDEQLHELAIRGTIRNAPALLDGRVTRERLRELMQQDGVQNPVSGISVDDVMGYMADHLQELLDHGAFGDAGADRGRVAQATAVLRDQGPVPDEPEPVA